MQLDFNALWEIFIKFVWPLVLGYALYLHSRMEMVLQKMARLEEKLYDHRLESAKTYVATATLKELEGKLDRVLERIDNKIDKFIK